MPKSRDVKGLSVITLAEGKKVGRVEEIVVDPDTRAVGWLKVNGGGGLFGGGNIRWVSASAVHSIGEHAVVVNSEADLYEPEAVPEAADMAHGGRTVLGKKVLSESGRYLGEAREFAFAPDSLALTSLSVGQGGGLSPQITEIDGAKLRTIGEDFILISEGQPATGPAPATYGVDEQTIQGQAQSESARAAPRPAPADSGQPASAQDRAPAAPTTPEVPPASPPPGSASSGQASGTRVFDETGPQ